MAEQEPTRPQSLEGTRLSPVVLYNTQSIATAVIAAAAAATAAIFGWPVWAMFLGWVSALSGGRAWKEILFSWLCFVGGIGIGAIGILVVARLGPVIGPLSYGVAVLGMATVIVSMRKAPYINIVPNYILGVLGIFALHADSMTTGAPRLAAPALIGAIGVWLAHQLQLQLTTRLTRR